MIGEKRTLWQPDTFLLLLSKDSEKEYWLYCSVVISGIFWEINCEDVDGLNNL